MKKELTQSLLVAKVTLLLLWPMSAWAATITFGSQLASIPLLDLLVTLILSTVMGATSLLHAMAQEYAKAPEIPRLWLFVSSRMLGSNASGLLVFFGAAAWDIRTPYMAGAIMLAAFAGTYFIERASRAFVNKTIPEAN